MRWVLGLILLAGRAAAAGNEATLPPGGRPVLSRTSYRTFHLGGASARDAALELMRPRGQPFERAMRVTVKTPPAEDHGILLSARVMTNITARTVMLLGFYGRTVATSNTMSRGRMRVCFRKASRPWTSSVSQVIKLGPTWKRYWVPFRVRGGPYRIGRAACVFAVGYGPQTLELADVQVYDYGRSRDPASLPRSRMTYTYGGRSPVADWRTEAAARIEQHRKGDILVEVYDAAGERVTGAEVRVDLRQHAYGFGSAVTADMLTDPTADGDRYRATVSNLYNKVVFENDLKYGPWEKGKTTARDARYNREKLFEALQWLRDRDIRVRGHTLIWGPIRQGGYNGRLDFSRAGKAQSHKVLLDHLAEKMRATRGLVSEWDVINHPVAGFGDRGNGLERVYGRAFYPAVLQFARGIDRSVPLFVNEGGIMPRGDRRGEYETFIEYLGRCDAAPDGIGFMCHFGQTALPPIEEILAQLDRFARFRLPLQATELDINIEDEACQADYLRDVLTAFFSHPATCGVIMWGFWEGRHWRPDAALYRRDWELKPAGRAWIDLVRKTWWSHEKGRTDSIGVFRTRGFRGRYRVTVTHAGRTATREVAVGPRITKVAVKL